MTAAYGQASVVADTTEYNLAQLQINATLARMQTISIAKVIACSNAGDVSPVGTVTISILVNLMTGNGQAIPHGSIFEVPYLRAQGGGNAIILDPVAGDIGMVGFASRDISAVQSSKGQANPGSNRQFDWADAIYINGMLNGTPTQYIQFLSSGINILSPTLIALIAPAITLQGATTATGPVVMESTLDVAGDITAASATFTGTFVIDGDGTITGTLTGTSAVFSGSVTAASFAGSGGGPGSGSVTSVTVNGSDSITASGGPITTSGVITVGLEGDAASPGNNQVYGTDGSGTKGWYPGGSGGGVTTYFGAGAPSTLHSTGDFYFDTSGGVPLTGYVQTGTPVTPSAGTPTTGTASTLLAVSANATTVTGEGLLVVVVSAGFTGTVSTVVSVVAAGLTFTKYASIVSASGVVDVEIWAAPLVGNLTALPVTATFGTTFDDATMVVFGVANFANWDAGSGLPATATNVSGGGTVTLGPVTTTLAADLMLYVCSTNANIANAAGPPAGYTQIASVDNAGGSNWCITQVAIYAPGTVLTAYSLTSPYTSASNAGMILAGMSPSAAGSWQRFS